jgi:hypothetical protein
MFNDERIGVINVIILIAQNYFYLTRRTQRAQSYYLTVDAGAGGVAVARDRGRRDDERKTENVDSLTFNDERIRFINTMTRIPQRD